jgi:uncharacterized membrane protein
MREWLNELLINNRGGIIGGGLGLIFALFIVFFGIINAILIFLAVLVGFFLGNKIHNDKDYFKNLLDRILPPGTYR